MEHAAAVAQLLAHGQLGFGAFGRAMEDIHAEEPSECREVGDGHCRSSAAVDVLIAWPAPGASRMRSRDVFRREDRRARRGKADEFRRGALLVVRSSSGIQARLR